MSGKLQSGQQVGVRQHYHNAMSPDDLDDIQVRFSQQAHSEVFEQFSQADIQEIKKSLHSIEQRLGKIEAELTSRNIKQTNDIELALLTKAQEFFDQNQDREIFPDELAEALGVEFALALLICEKLLEVGHVERGF